MKLRIIALTAMAVLFCASSVCAHGGHRVAHHNYNNYNTTPMYYCNDHHAHYHTNGICPYYSSDCKQGTVKDSCIFYEQCHPNNCLNPYCTRD